MKRFALASAVLVVGMAACDLSTESSALPPIPAVVDVGVVDAGGAIFRALSVETDIAVTVDIEYWSDDSPRMRVGSMQPNTTHQVHMTRLRASSSYEYELTVSTSAGAVGTTASGQFSTDTLPVALQQIRGHAIGKPSFPLMMLEILRQGPEVGPIIMDRDGFIVWYPKDPAVGAGGFDVLPNGDFAFLSSDGIHVVSPTNGIQRTLSRETAAARTGLGEFEMHHDVISTPEGNLLVLVRDTATVNDTVWGGESIWEWEPSTDRLERRWFSFDFLSPLIDRGQRTVPHDWLHANSLSIGPRGNIVVSFFWTHEVVSIAPDFQTLEWRLGGANSTLDVAGGAMDAGQHTAAEVATDRVLLFDNGRDRPGGQQFSRALEIAIDRESNTADIVWEFSPYPIIYAPILSSARRLTNGNTLVCFGLTEGVDDPPSTGPISIYEVSPSGIEWLVLVEGVEFLYRATPLLTVAGEYEVGG